MRENRSIVARSQLSAFASKRAIVCLGALVLACAGTADPTGEDYGENGGTGAFAGMGGAAGSAVGGDAGSLGGGAGGAAPTGGFAGTGAGIGGTSGVGAGGGLGGAGATGGTAGAGIAGLAGIAGTNAGGSDAGMGGAGVSGAGMGGAGMSGAGMGGAGMGGAGMGGAGMGGAGMGGAGSGGGGAGGSAGKGGSGGACQVPSPPSDMQQTINLTWQEMTGGFQGRTGARPQSASVLNFRNLILDQLFAANGGLNFCVRWESTATVSPTLRDQIAAALDRGVNEWFSKLIGHNCWPYQRIPVRVVGWATRDRNLLQWTDNTIPVYVNDIRENAPQCAEACGRFFHQQAGYTYPQCQGGFANHYDMSLWLTQGMSGGAGGDWGQRVGSEYFVNSVNSEHQHIWLHEFGHGLGFPDYYNWNEWAPGVATPNSVMVAGRASLVTDWDTWMIRHLWNNMKSRFQ